MPTDLLATTIRREFSMAYARSPSPQRIDVHHHHDTRPATFGSLVVNHNSERATAKQIVDEAFWAARVKGGR
jgi:hypothetical protein